MQAAENFVIAVDDHDRAESKTHEEKRKWLQAFRVAQGASANDTRLQQITTEKRRGVNRNQQNDCVGAQLLVTFFRPPCESCRPRESASGFRGDGCALGCALQVARPAQRLSAPGRAGIQVCEGGPPPPVSDWFTGGP